MATLISEKKKKTLNQELEKDKPTQGESTVGEKQKVWGRTPGILKSRGWRKGNTLKKIPPSYNIFQAFSNHTVVETYTLESFGISPKVACS